eukprot:298655_1
MVSIMKHKWAFNYLLQTPIDLLQQLSFNLLRFHPRVKVKQQALQNVQAFCKHTMFSLNKFKTDLQSFINVNPELPPYQFWSGMHHLYKLYIQSKKPLFQIFASDANRLYFT